MAENEIQEKDTPLSSRKKAGGRQRRVRILLRHVAIWLDNWELRNYPQAYDWSLKSERLQSLKNRS
jgi:hypothetical protein